MRYRAAIPATFLAMVAAVTLALSACGREAAREGAAGAGAAEDASGGDPRVRQTFEERVPSIDAALPLATQVDTVLGTPEKGLRATGWFSGGIPARIDVEEISASEVASFHRYYYEDGELIASWVDFRDECDGRSRHIVARTVYGRDRKPVAGYMTIDGRRAPNIRGALAGLAAIQATEESDYRVMLGRIRERTATR